MILTSDKAPTVGLVEVPSLGLYDKDGNNWTALYRKSTLLSKQLLMADLQAGGFDAQLVNLKNGNCNEPFGEVTWKGMNLTKTYVGQRIEDIDPEAYDAWGVTVNYTQEREVTCLAIEHFASKGKPVMVGGSDAIAEPRYYLDAGATAIVIDKSGAANWPIFDYVLGLTPRDKLTGVILADGSYYPTRTKAMSPDEWALPSVEVAKQCFGTEYSEEPFIEDLVLIGSLFPDIGCDRKCDFCQTPTYGTGFRRMSPQTTLKWLVRQKEAGAKCMMMASDSPIPGTPQGENIRKSGLLRFDDPSIIGGFWTPSCDTHSLSYEDISDWQFRLAQIGKAESKLINYHRGLTKMAADSKLDN